MDLTRTLQKARDGDADARGSLIQVAYEDLRKLAASRMSQERQDHTLSATALVHEVSIKLLDESRVPTQSRKQFLGYVSAAMRNLLVNHARTKGRQKRGGDRSKLSFDEAVLACDERKDDFLMLHHALEQLAEIKPRSAKVVEMRYFGGLSNQEVADDLEISVATVKRDWDVARAWLLSELSTLEDE